MYTNHRFFDKTGRKKEKKLFVCQLIRIFAAKNMVDVIKIASYICQRYQDEYGQRIDEMKLHKLLYFMQKECIVQTGDPMFPEALHAWKYGPVMPSIRQLYKEDRLHDLPSDEVISQYQPVFDEVFRRLAGSKPLTLVSISHGEESWKRARVGYGKYESSDVPMQMEDIREDAENYRDRLAMLKVQHDFLNSKGITNHEQFLWNLARHRMPVV